MDEIKLYDHQLKALEQTKERNRVAYYLDMGLGKTFVGSEKANSFANKILVVCQKSKISDWIEHFNKYYPLTVFDLTKKKQLDEFVQTVGKCVGVINYDLIYRRPALAWLTGFTLMLDESSIIQNETAKRSRFILGMFPENVILLSGTPTAGKYENLWSQVKLLGWNISKKRYWEHYVETKWIESGGSGFQIQVVTGYKNVDRLKSKLAEYGAVFMKSDEAFSLPKQVETEVKVRPSKDYRTFMKDCIITVNKLNANVSGYKTGMTAELVGDTTLTKRLYARMLCGQYSITKLEAFMDLIAGTEDRLIVFYNFKEEYELLHETCLKHTANISTVNGDVKDLQAYSLYDDSITLCQYQAGAMGLNLQLANKVIYFSLPERSELFEQSKKRIHRIGQEKTCFYYYLMCKGTVEEDIKKTLEMRKDYTDALFEKFDS